MIKTISMCNLGETTDETTSISKEVGDISSCQNKEPSALDKQITLQLSNANFSTAREFSTSEHSECDGLTQQAQASVAVPKENSKRMRWTRSMNIDVMRSFFRATECETQLTGYRNKFLFEWKKNYPQLEISEQRICDQRRVIINKKYLTDTEISQIKHEISAQINNTSQDSQSLSQPPETQDTTIAFNQTESASIILENEICEVNTDESTNQVSIELIELYNATKLEFEGTDPLKRPSIPKIPYNKKSKEAINQINMLIKNKYSQLESLDDLQLIVYVSAVTICKYLNVKFRQNQIEKNNFVNRNIKPSWKIRLEKKISVMRSELTKLLNLKSNTNRKQYVPLLKKYNLKPHTQTFKNNLTIVTDTLKQKISAQGKRLKRYNKSLKRKQDNKTFQNGEKKFYQKVNQEGETKETKPPKEEEVFNFWNDLWSKEVHHNKNSEWITEERASKQNVERMEVQAVTLNDVKEAVKKLNNWKSPGPDKIQNYWWKYLDSLHPLIAVLVDKTIRNPQLLPEYLTQGITYLKPKSENTADPKNYRPITCLNTLYKLITSIITSLIDVFLTKNNIITEEQKGCTKRSRGSKEQLIIDMVTTKQAKINKKNIAMAWIDYQKAYDSIPHSWLLEVLSIYKIDTNLIAFLKYCMNSWKTCLQLSLPSSHFTSDIIKIKRGIFQGDSWSPKWFALALNPLSNILGKTDVGYKLNKDHKINHLFYMDDIKLYASNKSQLTSLIETTAIFSNDIHMSFGIEKCSSVIVNKGKITHQENIPLNLNKLTLPCLQNDDQYKYLGILQTSVQSTNKVKDSIRSKYTQRLRTILNSGLNSRNKIRAINTWCIPIIGYSFGCVPWSITEIQALDRKTRTIATEHRIHHPNSSMERFYLPRKCGGRGLVNLESQMITQINNLKRYFYEKSSNSPLHKAISESDRKFSPLDLRNNKINHIPTNKERIENWGGKILHGKYANQLSKCHQTSTKWIETGTLYPETEGFMFAIQDQVIATRNYQKYIIKNNLETDYCRLCNHSSETIQHLTSACPRLANTEYLHRHNLSAGILHQYIARKNNLITDEVPYYEYKPEPVLEDRNFKLYWDRPVITDCSIPANRPDIIIVDKNTKEGFLIDIAHPNDNNLFQTFEGKIHKYSVLADEIKAMWHLVSVKIIPIVLSVSGLIHPQQYKYAEMIQIPNTIIYKIQRSVILETCRIVRKVISHSN